MGIVAVAAVPSAARIATRAGAFVGAGAWVVLAREEEFVVCFVQAEEAVDRGDEQCEIAYDDGDCGLTRRLIKEMSW